MATRKELAAELIDALRRTTPSLIVSSDVANGWPARIVIEDDSGSHGALDLYIAPVGSSHRPTRANVERRFQNPGADRPIRVDPNATTLLIGVWPGDPEITRGEPVVTIADANKRAGLNTRFSVFVKLESLLEASRDGWASSENSDGERVIYCAYSLLPVCLTLLVDDVPVDGAHLASLLRGSGAGGDRELSPAQRVQREVNTFRRSAVFSLRVRDAYGHRCAVCGLGLNLVDAAHIMPVESGLGIDDIRNGVALCSLHHRAYDAFLWAIDESLTIHTAPTLMSAAETEPAAAALAASLNTSLSPPRSPADALNPEWIRRRIQHYSTYYRWLF